MDKLGSLAASGDMLRRAALTNRRPHCATLVSMSEPTAARPDARLSAIIHSRGLEVAPSYEASGAWMRREPAKRNHSELGCRLQAAAEFAESEIHPSIGPGEFLAHNNNSRAKKRRLSLACSSVSTYIAVDGGSLS